MKIPSISSEKLAATYKKYSKNTLVLLFSAATTVSLVKGPIFNWESYFRLFSRSIRKQASEK
jgi:hypothetical protein